MRKNERGERSSAKPIVSTFPEKNITEEAIFVCVLGALKEEVGFVLLST